MHTTVALFFLLSVKSGMMKSQRSVLYSVDRLALHESTRSRALALLKEKGHGTGIVLLQVSLSRPKGKCKQAYIFQSYITAMISSCCRAEVLFTYTIQTWKAFSGKPKECS